MVCVTFVCVTFFVCNVLCVWCFCVVLCVWCLCACVMFLCVRFCVCVWCLCVVCNVLCVWCFSVCDVCVLCVCLYVCLCVCVCMCVCVCVWCLCCSCPPHLQLTRNNLSIYQPTNAPNVIQLVTSVKTVTCFGTGVPFSGSCTVWSERRCALRLRYGDLAVSIEVAFAVCCCLTVFSC
jgi:GINS complex subunit 2